MRFMFGKIWRGGATSKAFGLAISRSWVQILLNVSVKSAAAAVTPRELRIR